MNYDELALYSVIRSFEEERNTFDENFSRYVQTKMTLGSFGAGLFLRTADHTFHCS